MLNAWRVGVPVARRSLAFQNLSQAGSVDGKHRQHQPRRGPKIYGWRVQAQQSLSQCGSLVEFQECSVSCGAISDSDAGARIKGFSPWDFEPR